MLFLNFKPRFDCGIFLSHPPPLNCRLQTALQSGEYKTLFERRNLNIIYESMNEQFIFI